jgi:hypothetical protein
MVYGQTDDYKKVFHYFKQFFKIESVYWRVSSLSYSTWRWLSSAELNNHKAFHFIVTSLAVNATIKKKVFFFFRPLFARELLIMQTQRKPCAQFNSREHNNKSCVGAY